MTKDKFIWCVDVLNRLKNMRLSPVWVAIAAIASFRQVMLAQTPAAIAAPVNLSNSKTEQTLELASSPLASPAAPNPTPVASNSSTPARRRLHFVGTPSSPAAPNPHQVGAPSSPTLISLPGSKQKALIAALKAQHKPVQLALVAANKKSAPKNTQNATKQRIPQLTKQSISQETPDRIQIPTTPGTPSPNSNTPSAPQTVQPNQATPTAPTPAVPLIPGRQSVPQQGTPDRIQIPLDGDQAPGSNPNQQPTQPGTPTTPAPEGTQPGTPTTPAPEGTQPGTPTTPAPEGTQPGTAPQAAEPRVLVAEVAVRSETGELPEQLQNEVYRAIRTLPGRTTTRSQLQEDINAVFATGFFSNVRAVPEDTPLGVRVAFVVEPNPVLRQVQVQANTGINVPSVLPPKIVNDIFRPQYGSILNLRRLQEGIKQLNQWYQKNGYVLAQVVDAPQVAPDGTVTLQVAEGVVEDIQVRFVREGEATDEKGQPIKGRTRNFIVTRELELEPGNVFNRNVVQRDLQRVYGLGLFEDVNVALNPGQDPRKVVVVVNVDERRSGSIGLSGGISSASGLFGSVSFQEQNLGGNNQKLSAEVQTALGGQRETLFDVRFTDPWIAGDPYRTSYTVNLFQRRSISLIFDGDEENIEVGDDGDRPRVLRRGAGLTFTRPLSRDLFKRSEWTASAGLQYQRVSIRDADGNNERVGRIDDQTIDLTFSGDDADDLLTLQLGAQRDLRNDLLKPTRGSFLRFGLEQSVPIGSGNILLNRLRGSYSQFIPVNFTQFTDGPETLAFNVQAGTVLGDLPPYEAFSLGGSNSVRGYGEGELGSGRSFFLATAEYRFPLFSIIGGALFFDFGTDLGTAGNVPGNPAGLLDKPGTGITYGVGVRVNSPLGPLRLDYGFNDEGEGRLQFGIGEKF